VDLVRFGFLDPHLFADETVASFEVSAPDLLLASQPHGAFDGSHTKRQPLHDHATDSSDAYAPTWGNDGFTIDDTEIDDTEIDDTEIDDTEIDDTA